MNGHQLAARDPAMAALLGAIPGHDFGYSRPSPRFAPPRRFAGVGFGDDYGFGDGEDAYDQFDAGFGAGDPNEYFSAGFGAPVPNRRAPARRVPPRMAPARHPAQQHPAAQAAWNAAARSSTESRALLLDPNRNSKVKVERYSFSWSPAAPLVLGSASSIATFTQNPSTSIKGQRLLVNVPIPGFVYLTTLQIANVNVFVGGTEDAHSYASGAQNSILDLPRLDPQNRATAAGSYTGALPAGYANGTNFILVVTLQGPATLAGGYGQ